MFGCLIHSTGYGSVLISTEVDEMTKGVVTKLREFEGVTHARLAGRDGGVAGRYTNMWLAVTPRLSLPVFVSFRQAALTTRGESEWASNPSFCPVDHTILSPSLRRQRCPLSAVVFRF